MNWWDVLWEFFKDDEALRNYAITVGGLFAAGVGILALRLNARRTAAIQKQTETQEQTLETQRQTLQTQRDSLRHQQESEQRRRVAETFSRAIDQLGSKEMAVRLGAIYTLSAVANEEVDGSDWRQAVVDTLCAFIRDGGPKAFDEFRKEAEAAEDNPEDPKPADDPVWPKNRRIPADLEAAVGEIGKLSAFKPRIDLNGADLRFLGGAVDQIVLSGALLRNAKFNGAKLHIADLRKSILFQANFEGAKLEAAELKQADLREANLAWADLSRADLSRASLADCDLSITKGLTTEQLAHSNCKGANLPEGVTWDAERYLAYLRDQFDLGSVLYAKAKTPPPSKGRGRPFGLGLRRDRG